MRKAIIIAAILLLAGGGMIFFGKTAPLKIGDRAPDFSLPDQTGDTIKLSDYKGKKKVVLAFYIRAFTPG